MTQRLPAAVAATVREVLKARGLSQQEAAPIFGHSQQALSDRMTGRTPFTLADLERLAAHLGIPVAQLLDPPASLVDETPAVES
jgi:transcriptional regulator with XRE-family HTH domain